jgi:hypothetical protein
LYLFLPVRGVIDQVRLAGQMGRYGIKRTGLATRRRLGLFRDAHDNEVTVHDSQGPVFGAVASITSDGALDGRTVVGFIQDASNWPDGTSTRLQPGDPPRGAAPGGPA